MLCVTFKSYTRACAPVHGGISNIAIFDPYDFDFTQTTTNGVVGPYTAIALRDAGTGGTATATLTSGGVGAINLTSGGSGYIAAPAVSFTGGGGTGAAATAQVANGVITGFTVTAPGTGYTTAPTVVLTPVANTGKMYSVIFQVDEAEFKWTQSVKGCSVKYDVELDFQLPDNSHTLATFLNALDAAACCCGIGFVIRLNSGRTFIIGERYVNGEEIIRFMVKQDGSSGGTGKLLDDPNVANLVFKGSYIRPPYEYSGAWSTIQALTY